MGGTPKGGKQAGQAARDDAQTPRTATETERPGVAKVKRLLGATGVPQPQDVADVIALYPGDTNPIAHLLQTQPALGNGYAQQVFKLVDSQVMNAAAPNPHPGKKAPDKYLSGNFGNDPTDDTWGKDQQIEGGGAVEDIKTDVGEAKVLNLLRASSKRFDPAFMLELQTRLQVKNKSGAFNTETLRALMAQPQLSSLVPLYVEKKIDHTAKVAATITANKDNWLGEIGVEKDKAADPNAKKPIAGAAFIDAPLKFGPNGHGNASDSDIHDGTRADRVAKGLGYDSYKSYWGSLGSASLLGIALDGGGSSSGKAHPAVSARLRVAEAWLRQRHPNTPDRVIADRIGWDRKGNAAYGDNVGEIGQNGFTESAPKHAMGVHMHSFGLAIDISAGTNPYVFGGGAYWDANMEMHLRRSAQLFGGPALSAKGLAKLSEEKSSEELFAIVDHASKAFEQYLALPSTIALTPDLTEKKKTPKEKLKQRDDANAVKEDALAKKFVAVGYSADEAKTAAYDLLDFAQGDHDARTKSIWSMVGRENATSLTVNTRDMVVALRDVAGFMWGGTEMSSVENGDFMHFDLRNTEVGKAALDAGLSKAQDAATDKVRDDTLAAEKQNAAPTGAPK